LLCPPGLQDQVAGLGGSQFRRYVPAGTLQPARGRPVGPGAQDRQRGWNTQPDGSARRSGGEPGIPVIGARGPCSGGNELSSPSVYGCRGEWNSVSAGARSTSRPAYITAIESAISISNDRSWVMNRIANPN
jgi:hypothetical protein